MLTGRFHGGFNVEHDFSVNTNPLAPPDFIADLARECIDENCILRYPDYTQRRVREALASIYECSPDRIIAYNGASEALYSIVFALRPRRIILHTPCYGELEFKAQAGVVGCRVESVGMRRAGLRFEFRIRDLIENAGAGDLVFICNPSNPTGACISRDVIIENAVDTEALVVLDEAYGELAPGYDYRLPSDAPENIVIVKSLTKWLGVPGVRLGFIYTCSRRILEELEASRPPWNLNSLAEYIIVEASSRFSRELSEFIRRSREFIAGESRRFVWELRGIGLEAYETSTCFTLARAPGFDFRVINELLIKNYSIALRPCIGFTGLGPEYARIALRDPGERRMLIKALGDAIGGIVGH